MKALFTVLIVSLSCLLMSNTFQETIIIEPCTGIQLSKVNKNILRLDLGIPEGWRYNETIKGDTTIVSFSSLDSDSSITINRYPNTNNKKQVLNDFDASMNSTSIYLSKYQKLKIRISTNEYIARRMSGIDNGEDEPLKLLVLFYFKQDYYYHIVYEGGDYDCLLGTILSNVTL